MTSFPSPDPSNQDVTFFSFSQIIAGTAFSNTSFANMTERVIIDDMKLDNTSNIIITGLLNRVQHDSEAISVFGRIKLTGNGFTTQYSDEVSIGTSRDWDFKQMLFSHVFNAIPAGMYEAEIQLRVVSGTCGLYSDANGQGTRKLSAIVVPI